MSLRHNFADFAREARLVPQQMQEDWLDGAVEIGVAGYEALNEKTEQTGSVDTGAYRAEHVIEQGGSPLFEHPERVGPDRQLPSQKALGQPPLIGRASSGAVRSDLQARLRPGPFGFVNRRFVAGLLEFGSAHIEPRAIYATARDATEKAAERIANAISMRRAR